MWFNVGFSGRRDETKWKLKNKRRKRGAQVTGAAGGAACTASTQGGGTSAGHTRTLALTSAPGSIRCSEYDSLSTIIDAQD